MPKNSASPLRVIAAKGTRNGIFRIWFGATESERSQFVLTLTPGHVARALGKALPITLEDVEEFVHGNQERLTALARTGRERGLSAEILD